MRVVVSFLRNLFFFFNDTATTEIYTLSLHDALPISVDDAAVADTLARRATLVGIPELDQCHWIDAAGVRRRLGLEPDRKSTRLNSSHSQSRMPSSAFKKKIDRGGVIGKGLFKLWVLP